ncbi:MAG: C25 family cysteine peptidase [Candidatus Bathyarchaeia archaeon]
MFNTTLLTRTDENYNRSAIQNILRNGGAGWLFVLCHGSGISLEDYIIVDSTFSAETLASITDLYAYASNNNLPVVSSVACMNGAWDESILPPPFYPVPSFGEALLMSNAAGIAYIGSARSAFEVGIYFLFDEGLLNTEFYGATMLHTMILKAYNQLMGTRTNVSLGELFSEGLKEYVSTVVPLFDPTILDYVYANIFMLNIIGDPGLQLPVYENPFSNERIDDVNALDIDASVESSYFIQVGGITNGTIPIFKSFREATIRVNATGEKLNVKVVKTYFSGPLLDGYESAAAFETQIYNGEASITVTTNRTLNGLMLFKIKAKGVEARFYVISAGLSAQYPNATPGSMIHVEIFGLNIIPADEAYLTIGGWGVAYIPIPTDGFAETDFAIPLFNPGKYFIIISFIGPMPPPPEVSALFRQEIVLSFPDASRLNVIIASGTQYEPGDVVSVRIAVVLNGVLTDANLTVNLITPTQVVPLSYQRVNVGEYRVSFLAPSTPGTYFVSVKAEVYYTLPSFNATAYSIQAFTVTLSFEELKALIQSGNDAINVTLTQLSDRLIEIQTTLGTVQGYIEVINNSTATIVSELGNITLALDGIQRLINNAKGEVIAEVGTKFGSLSLTLEQLNGTIVQVSDRTVEIRTLLDTIMGNITETKNGVASIQTHVGSIEVAANKIVQEQLPLSIEVLWATFGATVFAITILVTLTVLIIRKLKPKP